MKPNKFLQYLNKIATGFEFVIALVLLIIIGIKFLEMVAGLIGFDHVIIIPRSIDSILSTAFILVIGVEFTKMLCKHTPETVIDVLLFAMARQTILYHEDTVDMLIGIIAIIALFGARKYLIEQIHEKAKKLKSKSESESESEVN
jgi:hypothetical protein